MFTLDIGSTGLLHRYCVTRWQEYQIVFFFFNHYYYNTYFIAYTFWGTCEERAGLLQRYTYGNVVCCFHPHRLYLAFLPMLSLPNSLSPTVPPLVPLNRLQCVMVPSLCPHVLNVQHLPMSENMWCLIFCSCVVF